MKALRIAFALTGVAIIGIAAHDYQLAELYKLTHRFYLLLGATGLAQINVSLLPLLIPPPDVESTKDH